MQRVVFMYKGTKMGCIVDRIPFEDILAKQNINIKDIEIIDSTPLNSVEAYSHLNNQKNTKEYANWDFNKKYDHRKRLESFFECEWRK